MGHTDELRNDQARAIQDEKETPMRTSLVGRVYNAQGELMAIIDPGDPDKPRAHMGDDGYPCYCDIGVNHRVREKPINAEKTNQ